MKRHRFDPISFLFGTAFVVFAAVVVSTDPLDLLAATWVWPAVLIVLGAALLLAPLADRRHTAAADAAPLVEGTPAADGPTSRTPTSDGATDDGS